MRRLLIIGAILVALWLIFGRETVPPQNENNSAETTQTEEDQEETTMTEEEEGETSEATTSSSRKTPQAVMPTPPELVEKVEQNGSIPTSSKTTVQAPVVEIPRKREEEKEEMSLAEPFFLDAKIRVYLYEWGIDLSESTVPAGNIGFEVVNSGQFSHHFAIRGVKSFGKVVPGETVMFAAPLQGGTFELYSPRNIDVERGMKETFRVEN